MYNICLYMVKDGFVAEELMQDAFLSAFDKLATFKGDVSFGAWLKRIVINKCLDYLKIKKATFTSLTDKNDVVSEEETDIEQIELQAQVVKEAILNLPEGYRTIVTLYLLEGFDHSEIAEILGISASTSRSQYYRAKSLLIKMIQKQNGAV